MDKKGFLLIQVLLGLFLLGLVIVTCLPILNAAVNNLTLAKTKMEMIFIAESIIEQIKSFDYDNTEESEFIFDIQLTELMEMLGEENEINTLLPVNKNRKEHKYLCNIYKIEDENLWKLKVNISPINEVKNITHVEIMAFLPIPKTDSTNSR